jgi:hypothetical protein
MASLTFKLAKLPHPYADEPHSKGEIWGAILLVWKNEDKEVNLIDTCWNLLEIAEWFTANKQYLKQDCPFENPKNKSIAQLNSKLYSKFDFENRDDETHYFNKLEDYFSKHFFTLRGNPSPFYYIGMNLNEGEISHYNQSEKKYKSYTFNMDEFLEETSTAIRQIV